MKVCICVHVESTGEGSALQENEKQEKLSEQQELDRVNLSTWESCISGVCHFSHTSWQHDQIPTWPNTIITKLLNTRYQCLDSSMQEDAWWKENCKRKWCCFHICHTDCLVFLLLERVKVFWRQEMFHFLLQIYYVYFFRDLIALIALNFTWC